MTCAPPNFCCQVKGDEGSLAASLISRQTFSCGSDFAQTASNRSPEPPHRTVSNLFTIHRATIDEPWRLRGFGGGPTYRCALWVALLLNQEASEREKKKYFDTENTAINLGAKQPAYKSCAVFLHNNNNNVSSRHLSEQWKDNPRGKKKQQHKIEHTLKEGRTSCCSRVLLHSGSIPAS